jgi:hypothetical protein
VNGLGSFAGMSITYFEDFAVPDFRPTPPMANLEAFAFALSQNSTRLLSE